MILSFDISLDGRWGILTTLDNTMRSGGIFSSLSWQHFHGRKAFWILQLFGWCGLTIVNYLSLTLWYNPLQIEYFLAPFVQSVAGMLLSVPLHFVGKAVWNTSIPVRIVANSLSIIIIAILWTFSRIYIFEEVTGDEIALAEYGGWLHASIIVFGAWVLSYHAVKYFYFVQSQRALIIEAEARALKERAKRLEAEGLSREAQMMMLRYQINPHFLFNALNSINALIRLKRNDDARLMLRKMSDFMRLSLASDPKAQVSFSEELENTRLYIDVEKTRFESRANLEYQIDDEVLAAAVPSMILQPIYENAFKYAVGRTSESVTIKLTAQLYENRVHIEVSDDGPGLVTEKADGLAGSTGIGLKNAIQRLQGLYGDDANLSYQASAEGGVKVSIQMPYHRFAIDDTSEERVE